MVRQEITRQKSLQEKSVSQKVQNPFPGLRPFRDDETHLFFGREDQVDEIIEKLREYKFIAILGTSGSGKSSLMYCGLLPSLYAGFMQNASSNWLVTVCRPGTSPIENLATALLETTKREKLIDRDLLDSIWNKNYLTSLLKESSRSLIQLIRDQIQTDKDQNFLIVIDQFEEIFRFTQRNQAAYSSDEFKLFVKLICEAARQKEVPIYITITMRSDYIGDCSVFLELTKIVNDSHFLVPQMTREQKKSAIIGPISIADAEVTPALIQRLLNDCSDISDQLPVLQHAMMRTWNFWERQRSYDKEPIDIFHYEKIGGIKTALSMHANEAYYELSSNEKFICSKLFKAITERTRDGRGIRRPCKLSEIQNISEASQEELVKVIDVFRSEDRNFITPSFHIPLESDTVVDISHESLMRVWNLCRQWVEEESESAKTYLKIAAQAEAYEQGQGDLAEPPSLTIFENWRYTNKVNAYWGLRYGKHFEIVSNYLDKSTSSHKAQQLSKERARKNKSRRNKLALLFLVVMVLVLFFIGIFAFSEKNEAEAQKLVAEQEKRKAEEQTRVAEQERLKAQQQTKIANEQKSAADSARLAALDAFSDANKQRAIAIEAAKNAREQQRIANEQRREADRQAQIAQENAREAARNAQEALDNQKKAQESSEKAKQSAERAEKLRYLSIAQSMAVKSRRIKDVEQKAIVAQQAYLFHKEYGGYEYQSDIHQALYYALKGLRNQNYNQFKSHEGNIVSMNFNESTASLFTVGSEGNILEWLSEEDNGIFISEHSQPTNLKNTDKIFKKVANSKDGEMLAGISRFNQAPTYYQLKGTNKGNSVELPGNWKNVAFTDIQFEFDDSGIYAVDEQGNMWYWSLQNESIGEPQLVFKSDIPLQTFIFKDKGQLIAGDVDSNIQMWQSENEVWYATPIDTTFSSICTAMTINPKQTNILVMGFQNGEIAIKNLEDNNTIQLDAHEARITQINFSYDGKRYISASYDGTAKVWDLADLRKQPIECNDQIDWVTSATFTPDSHFVLVGSFNNMRYYPLGYEAMYDQICQLLKRKKMTEIEWDLFTGDGKYEQYKTTCK